MTQPKPRLVLLAVLLTLSLIASRAHAQEAANDGRQTLSALEEAIVPDNDPVDLAKRLRGVTDVPPPPTQPRKIYQVGDLEKFWVDNSQSDSQFQIEARLLYATPHVYMWFESGDQPDLNAVKASADRFETHIYPTVHKYFGSEATPGIDGDVHLYILHAHGLGNSIAGYFASASTYSSKVKPNSNEHEMFFINLDTLGAGIGGQEYEGTLAHEFQHMVHHAIDPNEETWLNEGLSELSRLLNGYADTGFAPDFMNRPITQLDAWSELGGTTPHYGAGYLFTTYFLQRFGAGAVKTLVADPLNGLIGVDDVLQKIGAKDPASGKPITTIDLFADWQMANLLNDPKVGDGRYAYKLFNEPLPAIKLAGTLKLGDHKEQTAQWGTRYLVLKTPGRYKLEFTGQPTVQIVPTAAHSGSHMWWGNRADQSDTRLTHDFDLSGVKTATLRFWSWYSIEKNWDYGYVEVSSDGGQTWTMLKTADSDTNDPHANSYGASYTGNSGAPDANPDTAAKWVEESADLTPYVGKAIKVRFEYVTDDALALPGLLVDDIRVPEIGYQTDAESDDGDWQAEGFVRIDNTLPQTYLIQEVDYGSSQTKITRLLDPSQGDSGAWDLNVGEDTKQIVISISGMTEFTTEAAPYRYTLTPER